MDAEVVEVLLDPAPDPEVVLETKVIRMFPKISQSRRRPLLGPSPG